MPYDTSALTQEIQSGSRRALARMLTLVESGQAPPVPQVPASAGLPEKKTVVVGITGSGGVGKSTLIGALVEHLRTSGQRVGILASDPQSPVTGGALLGDRVRVPLDPADAGLYFRSLSTRGAAGGISAATGPAIEWLKFFGFDVILVETVGVGQDQIAIRPLVDRLMLVVTPASGDEVQWEKAGLIEVVDLIVVNKADLPGAERVASQLLSALSLSPGVNPPPVLRTIAPSRQGIEALWQAVVSE
jgi:LAO/AO transport system kinase